jgi:tetratricopeptide (TPR) repeat protein
MHSNMGGVRNRQGRWTESILECRRAISEAESVGELRALAHACYALDLALVQSGRSEEATHSWRALEIYGELGDPEHETVALNNLGAIAYWDGRWDDAVELYRRAGACGVRAGRPADVAFTDCNVGEILSDQGLLDEAEAALRRARRVWSGTGERESVAWVDALLARVCVRRGRCQEAVPILEAAMAELRRSGVDEYADLTQALIAEAEAFGGEPAQALDIAGEALHASDRLRPLLTRVGGIALARLGQTAAAVRELTHSLESARQRSAAYDIAATIDALDALESAEPRLLAERDEILERLKIVRLPAPIPVHATA